MIRTYVIPCDLPTTEADALNQESGRVYTTTLVAHYRVYRKKRRWLSPYAGQKLNDFLTRGDPPLLHAHSKDAAQDGFYKACKTARANRGDGARYPHKRKMWRTTIWKSSGIRDRGNHLLLACARGLAPIVVRLPEQILGLPSRAVREVRLVYDRCGRRYQWHLVIENGKQPKAAPGTNTVAVDLGEIHPAVATDGVTAVVFSARELRAKRQYTAKRMAYLQSRQSRCRKKSRRWWRLQKVKNRFRAKQQRRIRDMEHKISRSVVDYAVEQQAGTLAIGDVRDVADKADKGALVNQKVSTWRHGKLRAYLTYKAEAEGIVVVLVDEHYTSQTCPQCGCRHKPRGRKYTCRQCGFSSHRDVVGAANILSRQLHGDVGKVLPPEPRYRRPAALSKRSMRSGRDTGQPKTAVACGHPQEAAAL
jgi:putative transposase